MGQKTVAGFEQRQAVLGDGLILGNILFMDGQRFGLKGSLDFFNRLLFQGQRLLLHSLERPKQVDCRGAGCGKVFANLLKMGIKGLKTVLRRRFCAQIGTITCRNADGGCTTHLQGFDCMTNFFIGMQSEILHFIGQQGLIQNYQRTVFIIQAIGYQRFQRHNDSPLQWSLFSIFRYIHEKSKRRNCLFPDSVLKCFQ